MDNIINDIIINKSNIMKETIKNSLLNFSEIHIEKKNFANGQTQGIKEDFNEMISDFENMNKGLEKIKEKIVSGKKINNIIEEEDIIPKNENKLTIKFEKENIDLEINKKSAKFFDINIKIENFGTETYKKLFF